jgi:imidazoleglycerol-phosphate dehydratase/histidinol-phosphatase
VDGTGVHFIQTGLGFFDHMLAQFAVHGGWDLTLSCVGDLHVDEHHTVEDVAIALGQAIKQAAGNKRGINRYAFMLPMDESRALCTVDFSGRPYLVFKGKFTRERVGELPTEMVFHFFRTLAEHAAITLHIEILGENDHHQIEAAFKALARCFRQALHRTGTAEMPSSKGVL